MANHVPTDIRQFQLDLRDAYTVMVEHHNGNSVFRDECQPSNSDRVGVVLEPSVVVALNRNNGSALLRIVPLSQATRIEAECHLGGNASWTRSPEGLWLRFRKR